MNKINDKILDWFASGKVGSSSKTMAFAAIGKNQGYPDYPHDPDDFNRCLLLVKQVPEIKLAFDKISKLSGKWHKLTSRWDEIETCFIEEAGLNWCKSISAPKTYKLMKEILN